MQTKALSSGHYPLCFFTGPFDVRKFNYETMSSKMKKELKDSGELPETSKAVVNRLSAAEFHDYCAEVHVCYSPTTYSGKRWHPPLVPACDEVKCKRVLYYNQKSFIKVCLQKLY